MKKRILSIVLTLCLVMTFLPFAVQNVKAETETGKKITDYAAGDTLEFGYYPQSRVTDETTIAALNALVNVDTTSAETIKESTSVSNGWTSYGYYANLTASDYMRYINIVYNGNKYRGIVLDENRPYTTRAIYNSTANSSFQVENGYNVGNVYWFKYEPIKWRVLDPTTGLVISETILDSQAFNDCDYYDGGVDGIYVNNYEHSSIRKWLDNHFKNTAFSILQKNIITEKDLGMKEKDQIYFLSVDEARNSDYGFVNDAARTASGSDYAKSQGLLYAGYSSWWLRSACDNNTYYVYVVDSGGYVSDHFAPDFTSVGVRPAFNFNTATEIVQYPVTSVGYYQTGDTLEFGYYPQSKVEDIDLLKNLNDLVGIKDTNEKPIKEITSLENGWVSYGYYSGNDSTGSMAAGDWMRYIDIVYSDGNKYRGVVFDSYRPKITRYTRTESNSFQDDNGYGKNTVYWFKFEPITWRVLDPLSGLVMSEAILDSQAFNDYILKSGNEYYGDADKQHSANNYEHSSIRKWLNDDFYNTAFSSSQKDIITAKNLETKDDDRIYLLSDSDVRNESYGFISSTDSSEKRVAQGCDYAKIQGLYVSTSSGSVGNSYWRLRTAGDGSGNTCGVYYNGYISRYYSTDYTTNGIRPALNLNLTSAITQSDISEFGSKYTVETYTMNLNGDYEKTSEKVLIGSYKSTVKAEYTVPTGFTLSETNSVLSGKVVSDGSLVLKVCFDRNKYTLTTVADGKSTPYTFTYGQPISGIVSPTKTGYTFDVWEPEIPEIMPANELTVTAKFTENSSYIVSFYADTDTKIEEKTSVNWTDKVLDGISDPTQNGYDFVGWYCGIDPVTADSTYSSLAKGETPKIDIIAKWSAKNYVVAFNTKGGNEYTVIENVKWTDKVLDGVETPKKAGFTFAGWTAFGLGGKEVTGNSTYGDIVVNDNRIGIGVYANWIENNKYIVEFNTDGGTQIDAKENVKWSDTVLDGIKTPVKAGSTFVGWYCGAEPVTADSTYGTLAKDETPKIEIVALWELNEYEVEFDANGGTLGIEGLILYWDNLVIDEEYVGVPEKTGYTFDGWYYKDAKVESTTTYGSLAKDDTITSITLKATWIENSDYIVEFNTDGGNEIEPKTNVKWTDTVLTNVPDTEKKGYEFIGWYCGIDPVSADSTFGSLAAGSAKKIEITAMWKDIESPTIGGIDNGETYCDGKTFTVSDNGGIASVTANGKVLTPDASGKYVLDSANGEVTVVVTDLEGNTQTVTVTVNDHKFCLGKCTECGEEEANACFLVKVFRYIVDWFTAFVKSCCVWLKEAPVSAVYWFIGIFTGDTTIF